MALTDLLTISENVGAAGRIIDGLDGVFENGFARLGTDEVEALHALRRTFTGTPLAERLSAALDALSSGEVLVEHLQSLVAARASLNGARYDALFSQACEALGYGTPVDPEMCEAPELDEEEQTLAGSVRSWLLEVALAGFAQLEREMLSPFGAVLETLQRHPGLMRLTALLTGFTHELLAHAPTVALETIPIRRWTDLWTRALLLASFPRPAVARIPLSGTFRPIGLDLKHHGAFVQASAHGVIDHDGGRPCRLVLSSWKVDAVAELDAMALLDHPDGLLSALTGKRTVVVEGTLLSSGELLPSSLELGKPQVAQKVANEGLRDAVSLFKAAALDRHPAQLAIPVVFDSCEIKGKGEQRRIAVDGVEIPLAAAHCSRFLYELKDIAATEQMVALLRFDDEQWMLQPLTCKVGKKVVPDVPAKLRKANNSAAILQERASRLLRVKS